MDKPGSSPRKINNKNIHATNPESWTGRTQAWVEDQGVWGPRSPSQATMEWVWAQQMREAEKRQAESVAKVKEAERKVWEATVRSIDIQADRWMAQAEAARQTAQREAEKTKRVQEEVRRVRERSEAREAERRRAREEGRSAAGADARAKVRLEREDAAKKLIDAWNTYERRWAALQSSQGELLSFRTVPWPLICPPSSPSAISDANISFFLLSPLHSGDKPRKERLREAMQRWHNDKFEPRILPRVKESDREAVKQGVDVVVRCLNKLLARQSTTSSP